MSKQVRAVKGREGLLASQVVQYNKLWLLMLVLRKSFCELSNTNYTCICKLLVTQSTKVLYSDLAYNKYLEHPN